MRAVYEKVATYLEVDADELEVFANEDKEGGYQSGWPVGSIFESEGKLLYAICRILNPGHTIEIGTNYGCSATHLIRAIAQNERGKLHAVDIVESAGSLIPHELKSLTAFNQVFMDGVAFLEGPAKRLKARPMLIFEDGPHGYEWTRDALISARALNPTVIISHDILHFLAGPAISQAWNEVFGEGNYITVMADGSDCGLGIWRAL